MALYTQPASDKGAAVGVSQAIGAAPSDANRAPVAKMNYIQTMDATPVSNITSPQTLNDTTPVILTIPTNAMSVTFVATASSRVSEVGGPTSPYVTIPANVPVTMDVARLARLYLFAPTSGTPTVSFFFQTL